MVESVMQFTNITKFLFAEKFQQVAMDHRAY